MTSLDTEPATSTSTRGVLILACGATFLAFLDSAVVNLAFPALTAAFPATGHTVLTWIVSGFAVAFAAALTVGGRLADTTGHRHLLLAGIVLFALTSAACAAAPTAAWLIAARVGQGVGAALLLPAALAALLAAVPPARAAAAIGAWGATASCAAAIGPSVGAVFVDWFGWRSIFLVNIPACAVLAAATLTTLPRVQQTRMRLPDLTGAVLLASGTAALVAAVTESHSWGYSSPLTLTLAVAGIGAAAAAVWRSHIHPRPVLAVSLWRHRNVVGANTLNALLGVCLFAHLLAMPIFLLAVWRLTLLQAAAAVGLIGIAAMVGAGLVGRFASASNSRWFASTGMAAVALECAVFASPLWSQSRSWTLWIALAVTAGIGIGAAVSALSVATAAAVAPTDIAAGMGLTLTARQIGGAIGVAVLAAILTDPADHAFTRSFHQLFGVLAAVAVLAAFAAPVLLRVRPPTAVVHAQ